jgi:single-strand DNA-binding protein
MRSVNKVTVLGYVGRSPDVRATGGGDCVANFSVATTYKTKDQEYTEWHRLTAFGRTAEIVRDYVGKGSAVYVEGTLRTREWEQDGAKRYTTEIVVRELSLLGDGKGRTSGGTSDGERKIAAATAAAENRGQQAADGSYITDDDIPF